MEPQDADLVGTAGEHLLGAAVLGPAGTTTIFTVAAVPAFYWLSSCTEEVAGTCITYGIVVGGFVIDSVWLLAALFAAAGLVIGLVLRALRRAGAGATAG
jgi:hypothetical protein